MRKNGIIGAAVLAAMLTLSACGPEKTAETTASGTTAEPTSAGTAAVTEAPAEETVTVAVAASLRTCFEKDLIPLFEKTHPGIKVEGTYDSSGKLQAQIEEGAEVDVFFSAAERQMEALKEKGKIEADSVVSLLENRIVLIVPKGAEEGYTAFVDIEKAASVAVGDPESVPAGQYAREALENLGLWEEVLARASLGTNVTEVLNWVAEGSAEAGVVYATDAAQTDKVTVVAGAPEGSVRTPIYPVGVIKDCRHPKGAGEFVEFLQTSEAMEVFKKNGFTPAS